MVANRHRKIKKTAFVVNFMASFHLHRFHEHEKVYSEIAKIKLSAPRNITHKFL